MSGYEFLLGDAQTIEVPWWWFDALMVWVGILGGVLWLFGRPLVKPMFAVVASLAVAGAVALAVRYFWPEMPLLYWVIGGAVAGAAIGWLLARLAVAVLFAAALGILAPALVLVLQGQPLPAFGEPIATAVTELREAAAEAVELQTNDENGEEERHIDPEKLPSLAEAYAEVRTELGEIWRAWWGDLRGATRWAVLSAAGAAVVLGGALALVVPNLAGALMTSLLGVLLMAWPVSRVLGWLPARLVEALPREGWPLAVLVTLLVILGALIQWALFRPRRTA